MKSKRQPPSDAALVLVDLQNDFIHGGALAVPGGIEVVEVANRLAENFDFVVATQDWHPDNHRSFASQNEGVSVGDSFLLGGQQQIAWPDHCRQQSHGAEFVRGLNIDQVDLVIRKGTHADVDSYSGFFDNDQKRSTGLADQLRRRRIQQLFIMGLATDYCVKATVLDGIEEGFDVNLIVDGCRGVALQAGDVERAITAMTAAGAKLLTSQDLLTTEQ